MLGWLEEVRMWLDGSNVEEEVGEWVRVVGADMFRGETRRGWMWMMTVTAVVTAVTETRQESEDQGREKRRTRSVIERSFWMIWAIYSDCMDIAHSISLSLSTRRKESCWSTGNGNGTGNGNTGTSSGKNTLWMWMAQGSRMFAEV